MCKAFNNTEQYIVEEIKYGDKKEHMIQDRKCKKIYEYKKV